jgi:acetylornithine deacetylase/succinyl-diaminopimelate desuccinylase-like protein
VYTLDDAAPAWETAAADELVRTAVAATGRPLTHYSFCTNGSYFAGTRGVPTIGYGPGAQSQAHTIDEHVPRREVEGAVAGYAAILARLLTDVR